MAEISFGRLSVPFTTVPNSVIEDPRLTWKAKGLFAYIISRPPGWVMRRADLLRRSKDGRDSVLSAVKELTTNGYLTVTQVRGKDGSFSGRHWAPMLPDSPGTENPAPGKPDDGKPGAGKPGPVVRRNSSNTEDSKTEGSGALPHVIDLWESFIAVTGRSRLRLTPKRINRMKAVWKFLKGQDVPEADRVQWFAVMVACLWSDPWRRQDQSRFDPVNTMKSVEQIEAWFNAAADARARSSDGSDHHHHASGAAERDEAKAEQSDIERARVKSAQRQADAEAAHNQAMAHHRAQLDMWLEGCAPEEQQRVKALIASRLRRDFGSKPPPKFASVAVYYQIIGQESGIIAPTRGAITISM